MRRRLKVRILRYMNLRETWVIFFVLGVIMMNYPFINIFNTSRPVFGFPSLLFYLFVGWFFSICVINLFVKAIRHKEPGKGEEH